MRRSMQFALAVVVSAACCSSAQAGWNEFWHRVHLDYQRMVCWPEPFIHADRDVLREHYGVYERMGWQRQNTLGAHHFHRETHRINSAGVEKLMEIVMHSPPERRTVFVQQGIDASATSVRLDSVQVSLSRVLPEGELPAVVQTHQAPVLRPGDQIDQMDRAYRSNQQAPQLPAMQAAGGLN